MSIYSIQNIVNNVLNGTDKSKQKKSHNLFKIVIVTIIIVDIIAITLSTFSNNSLEVTCLIAINYFSAFFFTVEYILRIFSAPSLFKRRFHIYSRLRYIISFNGLIDLLSILPFTIPLLLDEGFEFIKMIELVKIFLIFKVLKYSKVFNFMRDVFSSVKIELILSYSIAAILIAFSGVLMYYVEYPAQPDVFFNMRGFLVVC